MRITAKYTAKLSPMAFLPARDAIVAHVETEDGDRWTFSKYLDSDEWLADAHFLPNGFPDFVHSEGERTTLKHSANDATAALIESADFTE